MNVTVDNVFRAYGTFKTEKPDARNSRATEKKEAAEISGKAKDFGTILQAVDKSPDTRPDRVQEIKTQVDMGKYNVSSSAIANKLLGNYYN